MKNEKKQLKPAIDLRCQYCGYTFCSNDYIKEFNRISNSFEIKEECPLCGCPCYPLDKQVI